MLLSVLNTLLAVGTVTAHNTMQYIFVNGQENTQCIRKPPNNNPVTNVQSQDMACNVNGANPASQTCSTTAGSSITFEWHHEGRSTEAIAPSHKGPIITYLAKTSSAGAERNPSSLSWFKIAQDGLNGNKWAVDTLLSNNGKWTVKLPSNIASGDYLIRNEIIALHSASNQGGAQFYIGCAQLSITGGGSASPSGVKFPGAYSAQDKGILVSIYNAQGQPYPSSYSIPGPAVYSG